jgi:hypothetical protein
MNGIIDLRQSEEGTVYLHYCGRTIDKEAVDTGIGGYC